MLLTTEIPPEEVSVGDTYNGEALTREVFTYSTAAGNIADRTAACYYSDGYFVYGDDFSGDANDYNEHLATMSLAMAMSAFGSNEGGDDYTNKSQYIKQLFSDIGMSDIHVNSYFTEKPGTDTIGVALAHKTLPDGTTLLAIALRGANYEMEWASNVTLGESGEHKGFADSAAIVMNEIAQYIEDYGLDETNTKFWIAGFSRAGAVSNLTAKRLTDAYDFTGKKIFAYTFEAPMGGIAGTTGYSNIKNIINRNDLVPCVAPASMGFIRYGMDIMSPYYEVGTPEYEQTKKKMLYQLAAVNSSVVFDDKFVTARLDYWNFIMDKATESAAEYLTGLDSDPSLVKKDYVSEYTQSEYIQEFLNAFIYYGMLYRDEEYARDFYSKGQPWSYESTPTFEDSLRWVIGWIYGMDSAKKDNITNSMLSTLKELDYYFSFDLTLTDLYSFVICGWKDASGSERNHVISELRRLLTDADSGPGQYMTQEERDKLYEVLPAVLCPLFYFISEDYNHYSQRLLGTFIASGDVVLQTHFPEVAYAWMRTSDSFFWNEEAGFSTAEITEIIPQEPEASVAPGMYEEPQNVQLICPTASAVIYYTTDGSDPKTSMTSRLYNGENMAIDFDYNDHPQGVSIKAFAKTYQNESAVVTFHYLITGTQKYDLYLGGWDAPYGSYYASEEVVITAPAVSGKVFDEWYAEQFSAQYMDYIDITSTLLGDRKNNNIILFNMPQNDVMLYPSYKSTITNLDLKTSQPAIGTTESTTAQWMFNRDSYSFSSESWPGNYYYDYKTGLALPVTWESAKTVGRNKLTIIIDPSTDLIRSQDYGNSFKASWDRPIFDKNITVTINGEAADVRFDGSVLIVTKEYIPKLTANAQVKSNVACPTDTLWTDIAAKLPSKVMVSTDMGNLWVEVSQWSLIDHDSSEPGTYEARGVFNATDSTLNLNGFNRYVTTTYRIVQGTVTEPSADVESGDYTQDKTVTLSAEDNAAIYYTLDGSDPSESSAVYTDALVMSGTEGTTVSYTLKALAVKNGVSSEIVEYNYDIAIPKPKIALTINTFDTNPAYFQTISTYAYQFEQGETVTVIAPDESLNNEQFAGWSVTESGGDIITQTNASARAISFVMPSEAVTLQANYIPVVNTVAITMDGPTAGQPLKSVVSTCVATVTVEHNIDPAYLSVIWLPGDKSSAWNTEYQALIMLNDSAFTDMSFTLSDTAQITVNGEEISRDNMVIDVKTGVMALLVKFASTAKANITSITQPERITGIANGTAFNNIPLPQQVTITTEGGGQASVAVTWDAPSAEVYDPNKLQQQDFTISGVITLPDNIAAQTDDDKQVALSICVNSAEQTKAPAANVQSGSYTDAINLKLTCDTAGADIYYTLDGTAPTTGSTMYTGEIPLNASVGQTANYTIKAIAAKNGMLTSTVSVFTYSVSIPYDIIQGKNEKWRMGSSKTLGFICNGDIAKFVKIMVDEKDVPEGACTVESGSTVVTLTAAYLETLSIGEHTLRIVYSDGYAQTNFTIAAKAGIVTTGDNSSLWLWTGLMIFAVIGLAFAAIRLRKNK